MARLETQALVLALRPFRESSLIVDLLTPGHGRIGAMARGARRPRSSLGAPLQAFALIRASLVTRESGGLATLAAADLAHTPDYARRAGAGGGRSGDALARYAYAGLVAEVLASSHENDPHGEDMFQFAWRFLTGLEAAAHPGSFALHGVYGLISRLGYRPQLPSAVPSVGVRLDVPRGRVRDSGETEIRGDFRLCASDAATLAGLCDAALPDPQGGSPVVSRRAGRRLMELALRLLESHLEKRLKSGRFLEEMILKPGAVRRES